MWLPVISDSSIVGASHREESILEAIIETAPDSAVAGIGFAWFRDDPSEPAPEEMVLAFREDALTGDRLGALVRGSDGALVLEVYARNVMSSLTEDWLEENWGFHPFTLPLRPTEKLEITVFALLLHWSVRRGLIEESRTIVRLIGRVVFRAAVRGMMSKLAIDPPPSDTPAGSKRSTATGAISAEEIARTDFDVLFRQLLGFEEDENDITGAQ